MNSNTPDSGKGQKRKRNVLTLAQKLEIINRLERGVNRNVIMKEYNIGSSTMYDIKNQKEQLLKFSSSSESSKATNERKNMRKPKLDELDKVLYEWFSLKRSEGVAISGHILISKAKDFYKQMEITEPCVFSEGWLTCFKLRHGIRKLDVSGERGGGKSADQEGADKYCETFEQLIKEHNLTADQIYNADETGLFWRCLPTSTLAGAGESSASGFKQNKDRLTVLTCANASGTHKVKLLVIGKFNRPRALKGVAHLPVVYNAQKSAWMNKEIFIDWFFSCFVPSVKEHFKKIGKPKNSKCILLLDNCRAHPHESELISDCKNIFASYLPPNVTSLIQPMDQGVIQNLKCHYRSDFMRKLIYKDCSIHEFQTSFTIKDAIFTVALAWNSVKPTTLRRSWRKLWPSVMFVEGSSDEEEFEGFKVRPQQKTVFQILETVKGAATTNPVVQLQESDIVEWMDVDSAVEVTESFTDEQIIDSIVNPDKCKAEEEDSEEEELHEEDKISWAAAETSLETLLKFLEQNPNFNAKEVMHGHILKNFFIKKRQASFKQLDIRKLFKKAAAASEKASQETRNLASTSVSEIVDLDAVSSIETNNQQ